MSLCPGANVGEKKWRGTWKEESSAKTASNLQGKHLHDDSRLIQSGTWRD